MKDKNKELHLKIIEFERVLFDGFVSSLSSFNKNGPFDILPLHSNFITLIEKKISYKPIDSNKREIEIKSGVLRNIENNVEVYLGL